ncbi:MAG TPA: LysM peptidoglycan-binding domain-containing protein [Gemmatimonadaceae bacterium]|jgi:nucleoid-associated protein YgaU|nr:LysM peptidoglycan-binding domain-containing protein [Gemmatimonadaceae bacterium]
MAFSNDRPDPDFSDVSGSTSDNSAGKGGTADFSDVTGGSSSTASAGGKTYIVKSGDNLSKIAKQFYGDPAKWKKIHAANSDKIPNPDLIHPGLQLTIPDA